MDCKKREGQNEQGQFELFILTFQHRQSTQTTQIFVFHNKFSYVFLLDSIISVWARLESSYCAPKNFGAHFKTAVRECKKIGAQSA